MIDWLEHLIALFHELHPQRSCPQALLNNTGQTWGKQNSPCSEGDEDDASRSWRNIAIALIDTEKANGKRKLATVNDLNNQHTASCCNFPSMHASRQRGPVP